jgi:tRNA(Ile)-lysidine synthase
MLAMTDKPRQFDAPLVERFTRDLDALIAPDARIGVAVSGGPDSLALLLLAASARPGQVEAATVDHGFRAAARAEAEMVAELCQRLAVPHNILTARWNELPETAIQERARGERYRLLGYWAEEQGLAALSTAHHADDQAETLLMRLARGAGVRGLAAMRPRSVAPGTEVRLIRPLLGWRCGELEQICADAGLTPARDPSNEDDRFERVRVRRALAEADWLDPAAITRSAAHLAGADDALRWATGVEWSRAVNEKSSSVTYRTTGAPPEIVRRVVSRAVRRLATEGRFDLRGSELDRLLATLSEGGSATLRGVSCSGGPVWRFAKAPPRRS